MSLFSRFQVEFFPLVCFRSLGLSRVAGARVSSLLLLVDCALVFSSSGGNDDPSGSTGVAGPAQDEVGESAIDAFRR